MAYTVIIIKNLLSLLYRYIELIKWKYFCYYAYALVYLRKYNILLHGIKTTESFILGCLKYMSEINLLNSMHCNSHEWKKCGYWTSIHTQDWCKMSVSWETYDELWQGKLAPRLFSVSLTLLSEVQWGCCSLHSFWGLCIKDTVRIPPKNVLC